MSENGARRLLIANQKGGVGKSSLAVSLGAMANIALRGERDAVAEPNDENPVAIASIDPQHSALFWAKRVQDEQERKPFDFYRVETEDELIRAVNSRPVVIIDSAGNLGEALLRKAMELCTDVLIPAEPAPLSMQPTLRTWAAARSLGKPARVVMNMWDPRDSELDLRNFVVWARNQGMVVCRTVIRKYKVIARGAITGHTVADLPRNRISLEARLDASQLMGELNLGGKANN